MAAVVVMNVAGLAWLSHRLSTIESAIAGRTAAEGKSTEVDGVRGTQTASPYASRQVQGAVMAELADADVALRRLKKPTAPFENRERGLELAKLQAREPANPEREQVLQQWLEQAALETKGEKVPEARGLQTDCRGQRCTLSATFANDGEARTWATRYLLSTEGKYLSRSKSVILPSADGSSSSLQLFLF